MKAFFSLLGGAVAAMVASVSAQAGDWCGDVWADNCSNRTIVVEGPVGTDIVVISGGAISITFTTTAKDITINGIGSLRNLTSVSVSSSHAPNTGSTINLHLGTNIGNVGSVGYSRTAIGLVGLTGTIQGNLTGAITTSAIGYPSQVGGLEILGDVTSSASIALVEPLEDLPGGLQIDGLTILGDLYANISAPYGSVGFFDFMGDPVGIAVDGKAGNLDPALSIDDPVTISVGGHVVLFRAGSFYGDLEATGNIYSVDITTSLGESGDFVGSITGLRLADPDDDLLWQTSWWKVIWDYAMSMVPPPLSTRPRSISPQALSELDLAFSSAVRWLKLPKSTSLQTQFWAEFSSTPGLLVQHGTLMPPSPLALSTWVDPSTTRSRALSAAA